MVKCCACPVSLCLMMPQGFGALTVIFPTGTGRRMLTATRASRCRSFGSWRSIARAASADGGPPCCTRACGGWASDEGVRSGGFVERAVHVARCYALS